MKRDIKKILGSADAEKIAEDYKAVDTKTSRRMFSNYLKKVGTANNQISETTDNSEIYKVEKANNTNIVRRISAFTAYAAAFVLLIGATVGIIKMKGPKTIKPNPSPQPEILATESTIETADKQTESTEAAATDTKKTSKAEKKETKESTNTVTTDKTDNKPERVNCYAEDESNEPTSEDNTEPDEKAPEVTVTQPVIIPTTTAHKPVVTTTAKTTQKPVTTTTAKPTSEYKDNNMTQNEGPTTTDDLIFESGLFRKLNALSYQSMTCDGLPEYQIQDNEGNVFDVNLSEGWVWRRNPTHGKAQPEEANLTSETLSILKSLRDRGELNPCVWNPPFQKES